VNIARDKRFLLEHSILSVNVHHYGDEDDYHIGGTFCTCALYDSKQHIRVGWSRNSVAVLSLNCNILFTSDARLTMQTMMSATEGVELPESYDNKIFYLDMAHDKYEDIVKRNGTGRNGKEAVFAEFLSHHPYPRWELVVKLLERLEKKGKARARLAQDVREKYLKSECSIAVCNGFAPITEVNILLYCQCADDSLHTMYIYNPIYR